MEQKNQPWMHSLTCHLHICDEPGTCPVPSVFSTSCELWPYLSPQTDLLGRPNCLHTVPPLLPPKLKVLRSKELFSYAGCTSMHFPVQIKKE